MNNYICCFLLVMICSTASRANAQDLAGHWGMQGDAAFVSVPQSIVEKIQALPEKPDISGTAYSAGLVRFNKKGAPSFALQFSNLRASIDGKEQRGQFVRHVTGAGSVRGFMATKYVNIFTRNKVSGGLAFGGGVGELNGHYIRSEIFPGAITFGDLKTYQHAVPLFEILGRVDFRPVRHLTVGPFFGIRSGTLAAGITVRIHAIK